MIVERRIILKICDKCEKPFEVLKNEDKCQECEYNENKN